MSGFRSALFCAVLRSAKKIAVLRLSAIENKNQVADMIRTTGKEKDRFSAVFCSSALVPVSDLFACVLVFKDNFDSAAYQVCERFQLCAVPFITAKFFVYVLHGAIQGRRKIGYFNIFALGYQLYFFCNSDHFSFPLTQGIIQHKINVCKSKNKI